MIQSRRGLTLLETLLASAMLAVLAGACVPTLSAALRAIDPSNSSDEQQQQFELSQLADTFMLDPQRFGVKDLAKDIQQKGELELNWPVDFRPEGQSENVRVRVVKSAATAERNHVWLTFTCGNQSVVRYFALPKEVSKP